MLDALDRYEPRELGDRLREARVKAGLTQEDASEKLKLARTTLVAIEKGQRRVRAEELRKIAHLYAISVNALLRPTSITVDLLPRFRARPGTSNGAADEAAKLLNDLAAAEVELERLVGHPLVKNYPPERPILSGDVRTQAEDAALEIRHRLGLGLAPISDVVSLLELEVGIRIFLRPIPSGAVSGLFAYDDQLGACILLNQNHPRERRALTAAHEFGHFLSARHEPDVLDLREAPQSREERFAVAFSLEFMMPAAVVRRRFEEMRRDNARFSPRHLILMAHALNVSEEGMCRRLEDLKLLPSGTWDSLKDRGFSGEVVRQVLGDQPHVERQIIPPRLWLLAAEAYRRELLSEGQLSRMLHMDRVEIRALLDTLDAEGANDLQSIAP